MDNWLPFMFKRKPAEAKKSKKEPAGELATRPRESPLALSPFGWTPSLLLQSLLSDPFFKEPFGRLGELERWFGDYTPERFQPTVDVVDEKEQLRVTAELPGLTKEDVKVSLDKDELTIRGEKKNEHESKENGVYRSERYYGYFQRTVPLPASVDQEKASASFENGVLSVTLPKTEKPAEKSKSIAIK